MKKNVSNIPTYKEINDFLKVSTLNLKTKNPNFFCLKVLKDSEATLLYRPAFKMGFYSIVLLTDAGKTRIKYDNTEAKNLDSFLAVQAPDLLYAYDTDVTANGYIIYFKAELFSFLKTDFEKEFNFFDAIQTSFFKLNKNEYLSLFSSIDGVFNAYKNKDEIDQKIASIKLLTVLYEIKKLTNSQKRELSSELSPNQILYKKYLNLINRYYLEKRTVEEYAEILAISSNYFSQSIKSVTNKNALHFINDKLIREAKSLIIHTDCTISEIAYQLCFTDTSYSSKFFKKHTGLTPIEYRNKSVE